jgi:hypothetical protein
MSDETFEMPINFDGVTITIEEKETLEENGITNLSELCEQSFKTISSYITGKSARAIQNQLIDKGLDFKNSCRVSLKTR